MAAGKQYELAVRIAGKVDGSLNSAVSGANKQLSSLGSTVKKLGGVLAGAAGIASAGAFVSSTVSTYKDFEQEMSATAATAGASAEEYAKLEEAARKMGQATTKTATEASEALGYMALAGWDVDTSVAALPSVLHLSEATAMDLATASDLTTDSLSALNLTVADLPHYLDVAAKANNKSNQSAQQLMEAYLSVGGTMANLHVPIEESAAALGVLANRGTKGSEAGTALNAIMSNLTTGTGQAGKMMEQLGISAFDSEGNFIGLTATLQKVDEATRGLTEEERNAALAAIGGKEHIKSLNALMSGLNTTTADGTTEWEALRRELENSDGALDEMAARMTDNLAGASARFTSAMDEMKLSLMDAAGPTATKAIDYLAANTLPALTEAAKNGVDFLQNKAFPAVQGLAARFAALAAHRDVLLAVAAGVGAAVAAYKAYKIAVTGYNTVMAVYQTVTAASAAGTLTLSGAVAALNLPVLAAVAAIGLLVAGGVLLYKNWDKVTAAAARLWAYISTNFPGLAEYLSAWGGTVLAIVGNVKGVFTGLIDFVTGVFSGNWEQAWGGIVDVFGNVFGGIVNLAKIPINGVAGAINGVIGAINGMGIDIPDWVPVFGGQKFSLNLPTIPYLAEGGIATAPTLAMIGEGRESEAVLPLSKLSVLLRGGDTPGGGGGFVFAPVINISGNADEAAVRRALDEAYREFKQFMARWEREQKRTRFA